MTPFEKGEGKAQQLAVSKREATAALDAFKKELEQVLKEFAQYYDAPVRVVPSIVPYPDIKNPIHYCVEADIYYSDIHIRHYALADLALLDLNNIMLKRMIQLGYTPEEVNNE